MSFLQGVHVERDHCEWFSSDYREDNMKGIDWVTKYFYSDDKKHLSPHFGCTHLINMKNKMILNQIDPIHSCQFVFDMQVFVIWRNCLERGISWILFVDSTQEIARDAVLHLTTSCIQLWIIAPMPSRHVTCRSYHLRMKILASLYLEP